MINSSGMRSICKHTVVIVLAVGLLAAQRSTVVGLNINLANIVGGGNGTNGGAIGNGIDPSTGDTTIPAFFQVSQPNNTNTYHESVVNFVDGVFIPDGGAGAATLDSAGHTFAGFPNTDSNSWDRIKNGPNQNSGSVLNGVDYVSGSHSMIGFHANKGITFDLQEIASANLGVHLTSFTTIAGMTHQGGDYGTGDWWVFVDGVLKQSKTNSVGGVGTFVNMSLSPTDRFLTLVSTDAGDGFSIDQIIFGDPLLHSPLLGDFNNDHIIDAADYPVWRENLGAFDESSLRGNGNGTNGVDQADYDVWRQNYGARNIPSGIGSLGLEVVPEPRTLILALIAVVMAVGICRRDSRIPLRHCRVS